MSALEIILIIVALIATALGAHAVGYGRGNRDDVGSRRRAWQRGYRQGMADFESGFDRERGALPINVTRPMAPVPVSVDGDEKYPPFTPKPARDVRGPE